MLPIAARECPWQEFIWFSHKELGLRLPLSCFQCGSTRPPLAYQTSQAAAPVSAGVLYLNHTRPSLRAAWLLRAKAAFHYSGQGSLSGLLGIRLQDQTLHSVWLCSKQTCKGVLFVQRQICPWVPPRKAAQHALETMSNGHSCWSELHLPDLIYSNEKHIHPFSTVHCL